MPPITILLAILLPVASATPVFPVVRPFIPHSLARAVPVPTQPDPSTDTVITGPIPTGWHHRHGPLFHNFPLDVGAVYDSDQSVDATGATKSLARTTNDESNAAATANTKDVVPISLNLGILIPPPPMTNVEICEALCSIYGTEPCGPCEDVSNSPDAIIPPPNAEQTNTVSARAATTQQDTAWLPLWHCLMQCIEERRSQCGHCNDYWTFYQSNIPREEFEDPETKKYIEMTRCLTACGGGRYGPKCIHCDALWNEWERDLSPYIGPTGSVTDVGMAKREPFRGSIIGMTLYGCLKGCNPEWPENSPEVCRRCRKMVGMFPPPFLHNWATERLLLKPEYHQITTGTGG